MNILYRVSLQYQTYKTYFLWLAQKREEEPGKQQYRQ